MSGGVSTFTINSPWRIQQTIRSKTKLVVDSTLCGRVITRFGLTIPPLVGDRQRANRHTCRGGERTRADRRGFRVR